MNPLKASDVYKYWGIIRKLFSKSEPSLIDEIVNADRKFTAFGKNAIGKGLRKIARNFPVE